MHHAHKSTSTAGTELGKRPPQIAQNSSSAALPARASPGSHQPGQAQGQVSTGLQPEFDDVRVTSSHGTVPRVATLTLRSFFFQQSDSPRFFG
ncbi:unnamed protein product [Prunus armeniaca]